MTLFALQPHPLIGETATAWVAQRLTDNQFSLDLHKLSAKTLTRYNVTLSEPEKHLLRLCDELLPLHLVKFFSKKNLSLKELLESKNKSFINEHFKPYVEKRIQDFISTARKNDIPIHQMSEKNLVTTAPLQFHPQTAQPKYQISHSTDGLFYTLSLHTPDENLNLREVHTQVLSNDPAILLHKNRIIPCDHINGNKLRPFLKHERIGVRPEGEEKYFNTFVHQLLTQSPIEAQGFTIDESTPRPEAQLSLNIDFTNDPVLILAFRYPLKTIPAHYGDPRLVTRNNSSHPPTFQVNIRNTAFEESAISTLKNMGLRQKGTAAFHLPDEKTTSLTPINQLIRFIQLRHQDLHDFPFSIRQETTQQYQLFPPRMEIRQAQNHDWFDLEIIIEAGPYTIPFQKVREAMLADQHDLLLPDGSCFLIPDEWFSRLEPLFLMGKPKERVLRLHKAHELSLKNERPPDPSESDSPEALINRIFAHLPKLSLPHDKELRPYQKIGVQWLYCLQQEGFGGILADDMGLGKTLQVLRWLDQLERPKKAVPTAPPTTSPGQLNLFDSHYLDPVTSPDINPVSGTDKNTLNSPDINPVSSPDKDPVTGPDKDPVTSPDLNPVTNLRTALVVVPLSLIHNWINEISKFTPHLSVYQYTGSQRSSRADFLHQFDLVLTTYGILRQDIEQLEQVNFQALILDESQFVKNPLAKVHRAARKIQAIHRIAITGTPIENSLSDLWAQMSLVNSGLLGSLSWFKKQFILPEDHPKVQIRQELLKTLIQPFILQRKKEEVAPDLPPLNEQVLYCDPSPEQSSVYESSKSEVRNELLDLQNQPIKKQSSIQVLRQLTRLRLLANHPRLHDPDYVGDSGKTQEVLNRIEALREQNSKVLVFSQFVKHLELLAGELASRQIPQLMLTGSQDSATRAQRISQFEKDPDVQVFLVSLKAGGTGLNLTAADYVFLLDPWWNPAVEEQAISRAHRIGQTKPVFVYRFITSGTLEEKIQDMQSKKKSLVTAMNLDALAELIQ